MAFETLLLRAMNELYAVLITKALKEDLPEFSLLAKLFKSL